MSYLKSSDGLGQLIDKRVQNEVAILKEYTRDGEIEIEGVSYPVMHSYIEKLNDYALLRVEFLGKYIKLEGSTVNTAKALTYFELDYRAYPFEPPQILFPLYFKHQQIFPNSRRFCIPELGERFWKQSTKLIEVINLVINAFNQLPSQADYPVDLSMVSVFAAKGREQEYNKISENNLTVMQEAFQQVKKERAKDEEKQKQRSMMPKDVSANP